MRSTNKYDCGFSSAVGIDIAEQPVDADGDGLPDTPITARPSKPRGMPTSTVTQRATSATPTTTTTTTPSTTAATTAQFNDNPDQADVDGDGKGTACDPVELPKVKDECKNDGWRAFHDGAARFRNQGDCVSFVATGGKNRPAG
ncbi:MAG TPA: hypothetical protein VGV57_13475 [Thermoleophilaceae bacterium]|nr:hypothetical protein [Thermoleophilaceae bacterium]